MKISKLCVEISIVKKFGVVGGVGRDGVVYVISVGSDRWGK